MTTIRIKSKAFIEYLKKQPIWDVLQEDDERVTLDEDTFVFDDTDDGDCSVVWDVPDKLRDFLETFWQFTIEVYDVA